jgi:hypothetical protein
MEPRPTSETMAGHEVGERFGLMRILRVGLGILELMPTVEVWHQWRFQETTYVQPLDATTTARGRPTWTSASFSPRSSPRADPRRLRLRSSKGRGAVHPVRIKLLDLFAAPEAVQAVLKAHPSDPRRWSLPPRLRPTSVPRQEVYSRALRRCTKRPSMAPPGRSRPSDVDWERPRVEEENR